MTRRLLASLLFVLPLAATAAPITTYTSAQVNSLTSVNFDPAPDSARDTTGADVSIAPVSGVNNAGFSNGVGGFTIKSVSDNVSASASLESATLKAFAAGGFGANALVDGAPLNPGTLRGIASASASFADSFRTFEDNRPFLWSDGDMAQFQFAITGSTAADAALNSSNSLLLSSLSFSAYSAGTLDLLDQLSNFSFDAFPDFPTALAAFQALNSEVNSRLIDRQFWYLGDVQYASFDIPAEMIVQIDPLNPTLLDFVFAPGGDFDWVLSLETIFQAETALENVFATLDFANTVTAAYTAPDGTTTYSASGRFPDTIDLTNAPGDNTVPVPATLPLFALGLLGLVLARGRRARVTG